MQAYDQGPFPGVDVAPWPPVLVDLVERQTGKSFGNLAPVLAEYERIRAFLGYDAFEMTSQLQAQQHLSDNHPLRAGREPTIAPASPKRLLRHDLAKGDVPTATTSHPGGIDPADLGD